ncbi:MAG: DUF4118 domain-containing protein [Sphingomicrobium sp.]
MSDPDTSRPASTDLRGYVIAPLLVTASTLVGVAVEQRWGTSAVDLIFLPAVLATAVLAGLRPALFAALASALAYNFFFTAPRLTFHIDSANDVVTVLVLFAVAVVTSQLAASIRKQARLAQAHATRNATIAGLARQLLTCTAEQEIAEVTTRELAKVFDCNAMLLAGSPSPSILSATPLTQPTPGDVAVAALVIDSGECAGRGVTRAVPSEWQFHPVKSSTATIAALGLARDNGTLPVLADQLPLLDNLLDQVALALERGRLEGEARAFESMRERDRIRSVLLASIGEDLKPPLASISEAVDALRRSGASDKELVSAIGAEAIRLQRYVANLQLLRPEAGEQPIEIGGITLDLARRTVMRGEEPVHLTPKEYAVFAELAKHPGRVLTHAHLLRTAWGPAQEAQTEYLRVAIRALRQKLEPDPARPSLILNEPAVGYRLSAD